MHRLTCMDGHLFSTNTHTHTHTHLHMHTCNHIHTERCTSSFSFYSNISFTLHIIMLTQHGPSFQWRCCNNTFTGCTYVYAHMDAHMFPHTSTHMHTQTRMCTYTQTTAHRYSVLYKFPQLTYMYLDSHPVNPVGMGKAIQVHERHNHQHW